MGQVDFEKNFQPWRIWFATFVGQGSLKRTSSLNKEQVEEDLDILEMVSDLTSKLNCMHNVSSSRWARYHIFPE